jgi:VanZ family protein
MSDPVAHRPDTASSPRATARWLTLGVALLIAWGSLYPLEFRIPTPIEWHRRLALLTAHIHYRADLIANFLLYLPFGAVCRLSLGGAGRERRTALAAVLGSALSMLLELAQSATPHRVTNLYDWVWNTAGAAAGALAIALYLRIGARGTLRGLRHRRPPLVPTSLLAIWLIGAFSPYVPAHRAASLGRLLAALQTSHAVRAASACAAVGTWWIIAECLRQIWRRPWVLPVLAALIGLTALDQTLAGDDRRSLEELLAWCVVPALTLLTMRWPRRARAWVTVAACVAVMIATNAWPTPRTAQLGAFHWVPFSGTLLASRDYRPLLDSLFLEGALLWSLTIALRRPSAAFWVAFVASISVELARLWTPPHRAEITNPLLVVALLIAFTAARRHQAYADGGDAERGPAADRRCDG